MSYLVLARKYRPQSFDAVVGQEHITRALTNAILRDTIPHALLFAGPRGVGKTSAARLLARALNCTGRPLPTRETTNPEQMYSEIEPCGVCQNCKEIAQSSSLAVWEIDGASNNSVDNVRELIDSLRSAPPPHTRYKIYILDEVHMLSTAAFNALLKSLEEPPPQTIFIFATTEPHRIPETVLSRCQRYDFRRLTVEDIIAQLAHIAAAEKVDVEPAVFEFIARKAQGGMRDAQSMLDRVLSYAGEKVTIQAAREVFGVVGPEFFLQMAQAIIEGKPATALSTIDEVFSRSIDMKALFDDLVTFWRNVLVVACIAEEKVADAAVRIRRLLDLDQSSLAAVQQIASGLSAFDAERLFQRVEAIARTGLQSAYPRYILEAGAAELSALPSLRPLAEIISALEQSGALAALPAKKKVINEASNAIEASPMLAAASVSVTVAPDSFNPSWEDFIGHVKERSELVLAAYLRRVAPRKFLTGTLEIEGGKFDLESLKEERNYAALKTCLHSYSGAEDWQILCKEIAQVESAANDTKQKQAHVAPNSLADQESRAAQVRKKKILEEAKNQDAVKQALAVFEGSSVERVSILDK